MAPQIIDDSCEKKTKKISFRMHFVAPLHNSIEHLFYSSFCSENKFFFLLFLISSQKMFCNVRDGDGDRRCERDGALIYEIFTRGVNSNGIFSLFTAFREIFTPHKVLAIYDLQLSTD